MILFVVRIGLIIMVLFTHFIMVHGTWCGVCNTDDSVPTAFHMRARTWFIGDTVPNVKIYGKASSCDYTVKYRHLRIYY